MTTATSTKASRLYDQLNAHQFAPDVVDPAVEFLADLARDGSALELGVGTGRIALPLAARGIPVHGIELSRAMAARLKAKPGADRVSVTIGDYATTRVDGSFRVAYVLVNTIMNLTTQEAQVAAFRNAAAHLEPGGTFVVECWFRSFGSCRPERGTTSSAAMSGTGASTRLTLPPRDSSRTTSSRWAVISSADRSRSATAGRQSST